MTDSSPTRTLIRDGFVLSMDPDLGNIESCDILIEDGSIAAVGKDLPTPATGVSQVIDARGKLVTPGLIDTHLHMWQTALRGVTAELWAREYFQLVHPLANKLRPEDMYWSTYAGGLELINHGVTSVLDYCHATNSPEHARASLRGHQDAGIRAWFGFGTAERATATYADRSQRLDDLAALCESQPQSDLVRMAVAIDHAAGDDVAEDAVHVAREHRIPVTFHGNAYPGQIAMYRDRGLLNSDMIWVHCNFSTDEELRMLAEAGAHLSLTPDIEMGMGKPVFIFERSVRSGVSTCLGVDVVSYACADILTQMRLAYSMQRVLDGQMERNAGHIPPLRTPARPGLSARNVVEWGTVNGARALSGGTWSGALTPGAPADILLIETDPFGLSVGDPAAHLILQTTAGDIDTVIVGGRVRKHNGRLLDFDRSEVSRRLYETREHLIGSRGFGIDVKSELARSTA